MKSLKVLFSEKKDGNMKLGGQEVPKNREVFLKKQDISLERLVSADLVHGNKIAVVKETDAGKVISNVDGLITNQKNLFLSVTVADCLPIFLFDPQQQAIGIVHAGWRSLAQNILHKAIEMFKKEYNAGSKEILASIGPGISQCHFEVGPEVIDVFKEIIAVAPEAVDDRQAGKYFLDLKLIATMQLCQSGLKYSNIEVAQQCTFCEKEKYFSFRRDKPENVEAMLAVIGITN